jgi:hypothetical protein
VVGGATVHRATTLLPLASWPLASPAAARRRWQRRKALLGSEGGFVVSAVPYANIQRLYAWARLCGWATTGYSSRMTAAQQFAADPLWTLIKALEWPRVTR